MKVSQSSHTCFRTQVKAAAAMETCKQELFQAHADAANRHNGLAGKMPKDKNKGKGGKGKSGGKGLPFHYL